jgi:hypothetical protein
MKIVLVSITIGRSHLGRKDTLLGSFDAPGWRTWPHHEPEHLKRQY